ncbi:hypothetical protein [Mycobacterium kyogaense]|uniref:hypothetical protein n=1 Tax=Mycobacterium kyogaense TaxID=2212479 RepID=UPI000DAB889F|nr:hypothetical protein [Mycobacterium kyogaense]
MGGASGGGQYGGSAAGAASFPNRAWIQIAGGEDPNTPSDFSGAMSTSQRRSIRNAKQKVDDTADTVSSAQASLDELNGKPNVTAQERTTREKALARAQREHQDAIEDLTDTQNDINEQLREQSSKGARETLSGGSGGPDGKSFGQTLVSGMLETIG